MSGCARPPRGGGGAAVAWGSPQCGSVCWGRSWSARVVGASRQSLEFASAVLALCPAGLGQRPLWRAEQGSQPASGSNFGPSLVPWPARLQPAVDRELPLRGRGQEGGRAGSQACLRPSFRAGAEASRNDQLVYQPWPPWAAQTGPGWFCLGRGLREGQVTGQGAASSGEPGHPLRHRRQAVPPFASGMQLGLRLPRSSHWLPGPSPLPRPPSPGQGQQRGLPAAGPGLLCRYLPGSTGHRTQWAGMLLCPLPGTLRPAPLVPSKAAASLGPQVSGKDQGPTEPILPSAPCRELGTQL